MDIKDLIGIGFTKNESKVYLSLIEFGSSDAHGLIRDTKLHKKLVYENLEKLIDKGLVTFIVEKGRRIFKVAPPNMLVQMFEEKEKEIKKEKENAERIAEEIKKISKKVIPKQEASVYKGVKGIKSFYNELLNIGKNYIVFGAPERSLGIMGEVFWRNFNVKRIDKKIKPRLIFNESIRDYGESIKNKFTEVQYFDKDFEPLTETNIQEDRVAIIVWTDEPILFLIQDKFVAESYKKYFEEMWKTATP